MQHHHASPSIRPCSVVHAYNIFIERVLSTLKSPANRRAPEPIFRIEACRARSSSSRARRLRVLMRGEHVRSLGEGTSRRLRGGRSIDISSGAPVHLTSRRRRKTKRADYPRRPALTGSASSGVSRSSASWTLWTAVWIDAGSAACRREMLRGQKPVRRVSCRRCWIDKRVRDLRCGAGPPDGKTSFGVLWAWYVRSVEDRALRQRS